MEDMRYEWLKNAREKLYPVQRDMARALDITPSLYSMLERGERRLTKKYIDRICERTKISRSYLETGTGPMLKDEKDKILFDLIMSLGEDDKQMLIGMAKRLAESSDNK